MYFSQFKNLGHLQKKSRGDSLLPSSSVSRADRVIKKNISAERIITMANMNEMMSQMMEKMMEACMANMMNQMMSSMQSMMATPVVEEPKKVEKPKMSKEDFMNLELSATPTPVVTTELDFVPMSMTSCKYNQYVGSDVWIINHIAITGEYKGRWSSKIKGYKFETASAMQNFFNCYKIKTELTDADKARVAEYRRQSAQKKAEYYTKQAQG
jgi:hypothetical protein